MYDAIFNQPEQHTRADVTTRLDGSSVCSSLADVPTYVRSRRVRFASTAAQRHVICRDVVQSQQ